MLSLSLLICSLAWGQQIQAPSLEATPVVQASVPTDAALAALDPIDVALTQRLLGDAPEEVVPKAGEGTEVAALVDEPAPSNDEVGAPPPVRKTSWWVMGFIVAGGLVVYFFQKKAMPGLGSSEHLKVVARHTLGGNGGLVLVEIGDKDPKRRLLLSTGAGATQLILDMGYVGMPEEDVSAAVVENVLPAASGVTQAVEARTNQSFEALMQESIRQPVVTVQDVASVRQSSSLDEALLDLPGVEENKVMKPAVQSREIFHTAEPAQKNVDRSALQALNVPSVLTAPSPGEGTAATRNKQGVNRKSAAARFLSAAQMAPPARQYIANSPSAAPATPVVQREQRKPAPPVPSKPVNPAFTAALDLIDDELRRRDEELVGGV